MYSDFVCCNYCLWWWRSYTWPWLHGLYYWYWETTMQQQQMQQQLHFSSCIWMLRVVEGPSTNIRCVTVCHILCDLHGMPNTRWWHHVVMPVWNIPVKKEIFLPFCGPHLPLMLWHLSGQLQGSRPVLWPGWACSQAAKWLLVTN